MNGLSNEVAVIERSADWLQEMLTVKSGDPFVSKSTQDELDFLSPLP